jgi:methionyl-tRNA formyltransferase
LQIVDQLQKGSAEPVVQDKGQATKAPRLTKEHGQIDWSRSAPEIKNQVRALQPWPRAYTAWQRPEGEPVRLIVHQAAINETESSTNAAPGTVVSVEGQLFVACGRGVLSLQQVQPAGKRAMTAEEFLRGNPVQVGHRLV